MDVPGGAVKITFEILPPVPVQVVSRSFTAMPVLFVSDTVVMNPAWLGVPNAKVARSPAARLRNNGRFIILGTSIKLSLQES
jgi:hypothetical protein